MPLLSTAIPFGLKTFPAVTPQTEIWVEYFSKKDYKFYFIDNDHKKNLFYPKNIKTFKAAKELLYDLSDLNNEGKLSKDYLININNYERK